MKYRVYTDGAGNYEKKLSGASYVILTDTHYIASGLFTIQGESNPTCAETIGVGVAAGFMLQLPELKEDDEIEFYVDCKAAIDYYEKFALINGPLTFKHKNQRIELSVKLVYQLNQKAKISMCKIHGHKDKHNPNKYCDALAKLAIRR